MTSVFDILPRLHSLLALLLVKAQNPQLSLSKLSRLGMTVARLTRLIIREEAAAAHHRLKTAMLADPTWRARVIWELGGVEALQIWRQQFLFKRADKVERGLDSSLEFQASAPENSAANHDAFPPNTPEPKRQYRFRLKQPPRPFYGRRPADAGVYSPNEPKPAISLLDVPIPLMPYDFWPAPEIKTETKSAVPSTGYYGVGDNANAKPDKDKAETPPPTPDPP